MLQTNHKKDWILHFPPVSHYLTIKRISIRNLVFTFHTNMSSLSYQQLPVVTLTMVNLFDKFDGYEPVEIEVFIETKVYRNIPTKVTIVNET